MKVATGHLVLRTWCVVVLLALAATAAAQGTLEDYNRAERFLAPNVRKLVFEGQVNPNWIERTAKFWYRNEAPAGKEFILVDAAANTRGPAFDHEKLAAALASATKKAHKASDLPFNTFEFVEKQEAIEFEVENARWNCKLATYECAPKEARPQRRLDVPSPDGKLVAFVRGYNLWVRMAATGEEIQLSQDGERFFEYATPLPSVRLMVEQETEEPRQTAALSWSPNSKTIATFVMDQRGFPRLTMTQAAPPNGFRPRGYHYAYPLPGDFELPKAILVVFDVERRTQVRVQARPVEQFYYGAPQLRWLADSERLHYSEIDRGYKAVRVREVRAASGETRVLIEEKAETSVNVSVSTSRMMSEGSEMIWSSERDGWNHLYLYDLKTGQVKNQITRGDWVVRRIEHVDEKARQVYFTAGGREKERDPYLRHLYRIGLDGSGLTLLTPEDADHSISFSPDGEFFVDAASRVDWPGGSLLRRAEDGSVVRELEKAEIAQLLATGWKFPEPFKAVARDGKTEIYGLIWRPSNFDPKKKYPVVENIYTGPHSAFVPKTFAAYRHHAQAIAELGFICVFVDGMGTALRSKAFHSVSYKNLGDGGLEDHIAAMKQMAARLPQMDLTRVGVWGHSAGGYDSTHALLTRPEFYKAAVSSAGNHDHRMDKAWWVESWMGTPVGPHYAEQSNVELAAKLQGKLLLAHGDVDENVPIAATLKLVDALIKANKDFELIILPNRNHGFGTDPYFVRRRWDFFVRHLLGVTPPEGFKIAEAREGAN